MAQKWQEKIKIVLLFLLAITPFLIFSSLLYLKDPLPWPDEGIFLDIANNFSTKGTFSTILFKDTIPGMSQYAVWQPPMYSYFLSIWTNTFGTSIIAVRALSLLLGIFSLAVFFLIAKHIFNTYYYATLATLLLSIDPNFNQSSRIGRMDILAFFFILCSFLIILNALNSTNKKLYLCSGIFCSLAILSHVIALLAPAIIALSILLSSIKFREKVNAILFFSLPVALGFVIWFLTIIKTLNIFIAQMQMHLAKKAAVKSWVLHRWGDGQWQILIILCLIALFIFALHVYKNRSLKNYFLLAGFIISATTVIFSKEQWYFLYFQPFLALILISLLKNAKEESGIIKQTGIYTLLLIIAFISFNIIFSKMIIYNSNFNFASFTKNISENIEPNSTVFLSVIPDPYLALRGKNGLKFYEFPPGPTQLDKYRGILNSSDYIVLNALFVFPDYTEQYLEKNSLSSKIIGEYSGYKTKIFKLKPPNQRGF